MTTSQLFIPTKLKVGFVHRQDTYTQKLAYIIYFDTRGILRKETSWENWRDKSIEPVELDNTPHSGFILNKDVQRYGWSHYSSARSMIRIYDDRGIEFEITPANLLFILMNTNCFKRELEGEFVYAWDGKELVLLPVGCEEYKASTNFTELQGTKLTAKDMIPGCIYKTKKDENLVYLGKFPWLTHTHSRGLFIEKRYVFSPESSFTKDINKVYFDGKNNLNDLAKQVTDTSIESYATLIKKFATTINAGYPVKFIRTDDTSYGHNYIKLINETCIEEYTIEYKYSYLYYRDNDYYLTHVKTYNIVDGKFKIKLVKNAPKIKYTKEELSKLKLNQQYKRNIKVELNNGKVYDYR